MLVQLKHRKKVQLECRKRYPANQQTLRSGAVTWSAVLEGAVCCFLLLL